MTETKQSYSLRNSLKGLVESAWFVTLITVLIIANAVTLGIDTYPDIHPQLRSAIHLFDNLVIGIFVIELLLKLFVYRLTFFKSGWNIFDFVIVAVSVLPGSGAFQVLRSLRVLRILRLLHVVPMMKHIVEALFKALPGMGAILAVLALMVYVGSVMSTNMFGTTDNEEVAMLFGDLPSSAFTLFQVMTMDGWRNEVVQKVMDDGHPYAWVFFLTFIFLASFAVLNLFIALIVEALQAEQEAQQDESIEHLETEQMKAARERQQLIALVTSLKTELADMRAEIRDQSKTPEG